MINLYMKFKLSKRMVVTLIFSFIWGYIGYMWAILTIFNRCGKFGCPGEWDSLKILQPIDWLWLTTIGLPGSITLALMNLLKIKEYSLTPIIISIVIAFTILIGVGKVIASFKHTEK